eukprot:TRINITY_DN26582_c0_g1_i1.p1 TRINITY_DN26582_c0_g1~~TRINITY_DN26582_c0_g1_i1.p1  ORF type:complete len:466 (+),score=194.17 TRINITY_DN26582_c0_g1_i1:54-1451(+)
MFQRTGRTLMWSAPRMSRADCGAKVVTYCEKHPVSGIAMFTDIGSRYEDDTTRGCSRLLEKMAYGVKGSGPQSFYNVSGNLGVVNHREVMMYHLVCLRWEVEEAFRHLSRMAVNPEISEESLAEAKGLAVSSVGLMRQDPSKILFELLHQAAWRDNTLGLPALEDTLLDPATDLDAINAADYLPHVTPKVMSNYLDTFVQPAHITVAARGVEHEAMLEIVNSILSPLVEGRAARAPSPALPAAEYTGGIRLMQNLSAPQSIQKFEEKNHTHVGIMFNGVPLDSSEQATQLVIQTMLGGGMSFSAGGPGKGMLTKLYRECLCSHEWLDAIEGLSAAYSDTGLLGIYGQAAHDKNVQLFKLIRRQLAEIPERLSEVLIKMATNKCLSQRRMAFEERVASLEDLGRWAATTDKEYCHDKIKQEISEVTLDKVEKFVAPRVRAPPTIAVYGNLDGLGPQLDMYKEAIMA